MPIEAQRLARLRTLALLDTPEEDAFNRVVRVAAYSFQVPFAFFTLVDAERVWAKASLGLGQCSFVREHSICGYTVSLQQPLIVEDLTQDPRFQQLDLVTQQGLRFYAGIPLCLEGHNLGTLCIADTQARSFHAQDLAHLQDLAAWALDLLRHHEQVHTLEHAQKQLQSVLTSAADAIITLDEQGYILDANPACESLFGYTIQELIGIKINQLMPKKYADAHDFYLQRYLKDPHTKHIIGIGREVEACHKDGRVFPVRLSVGENIFPDGRRTFIGILHDLSEFNTIKQALEQQKVLFNTILESSSDPIFAKNIHGDYLFANSAAQKIMQISMDPHTKTSITEGHHSYILTNALEKEQQVLTQRQTLSYEKTLQTPEQTYVLQLTKSPLIDTEGQLIGLVGVGHDISRRKKVEQELAENHQRLELTHSLAKLGVWEWNLEKNYLCCNPQMLGLFNVAGQWPECITQPDEIFQLIDARDHANVQKALALCLEGEPLDIEYRVSYQDMQGQTQTRWILQRGDALKDTQGNPIGVLVGVVQDITQIKLTQMQAESLQTQLETAIENIPDGFALYNQENILVLCNQRYREIYPFAASAMYTGNSFENIIRTGVQEGQFTAALGQEEAWIEWRLAEARKPMSSFIYPIEGKRWIQVANRMIDHLGWVSVQTDITELKVAQEAAESANQAKSEFLSSMSHELRTPMNAILGFAQLMENSRREPLSDRQRKQIQQIIRAGKHLLELINEILDLARIETGRLSLSLENIDVHTSIQEILSLTQPLAQARQIKVSLLPQTNPNLYVKADYVRIKQVLINLVSNAIKYNHEQGQVFLDYHLLEDAGTWVRIHVKDTGPGLTQAQQALLFQPFQRLGKETSGIEGTGIGLSITRHLVELMGGRIGVASQPGQGADFWFDLPYTEQQVLNQEPVLQTEDSHKLDPNILLDKVGLLYIEDNPQNLSLMQEILQEYPRIYLMTASHAQEGIQLAQQHQPKLIIMDLNLPEMDGFAAFHALHMHEETKQIPVIALSADVMETSIHKARQLGFHDYLTKPLDLQRLQKIIHELLT